MKLYSPPMDWNEQASTWDAKAVKLYAAAAFERLAELLDARARPLEGLRVLDFGCGTGLLSEKLAPRCAEVVALDPAAKMIEMLRAKVEHHGWSHVHPLVGTLDEALAARTPQLSEPFDVVVCSSVCAFVPDYPGTVNQLANMLAPGGHFVQFDWELDANAEDPYGLSREAIERALGEADLTECVVETAFEREFEGFTMKPLVGIGLSRR